MGLKGSIQKASRQRIAGWAWDPDAPPGTRVSLVVSANGEPIGRCLAERYQSKLAQKSIGDGRHAFDFRPPGRLLSPLKRYEIAVRREGDGAPIANSPITLAPTTDFDPAVRETVAQLLSHVADDADLADKLGFVAELADRLRQLHADRASQAEARRDEQAVKGRGPTSPREAVRPRALVVDDRLPIANHDAGSNAVLSHVRSLQRLGYEVTFVPTNLRGDAAALEAEHVAVCLHPWYASVEEVLKRQQRAFALVYLHRVSSAARYTALAREHQPRARIVYSVADLHHVRLARQAQIERRPELLRCSERLRLSETVSAWQADAVITHSSAEAEMLRKIVPPERVHVVPWSVALRPTPVPFAKRHGFAFVGGYGHQPNVDAAHWLVDHVMPELEALGGGIACQLVGSNMPDSLRNLNRRDVEPVGHLPDLATLFAQIRLTVAPLAYGAGTKGKVLDSLAAGVPCVCTPAAAEGLDLPDVLLQQVGSTPAELARMIRTLHDDEVANRACSEAGLAYIAETAHEARLDDLMREVIRG